jgi:hypothetical protein
MSTPMIILPWYCVIAAMRVAAQAAMRDHETIESGRDRPEMKTVSEQHPLANEELQRMAAARFGDMVKAVVDVSRGVMVVDAEMHSDEEAELLAGGSRQENLWGINLYPGLSGEHWLEYDSMINLRPSRGNMSRGVDDPAIREDIRSLVRRLVKR